MTQTELPVEELEKFAVQLGDKKYYQFNGVQCAKCFAEISFHRQQQSKDVFKLIVNGCDCK